MPVGLYPWNVAITPDGKRALVNNFGTPGGSDGNADSVSIIDLTNDPSRVVQHVTDRRDNGGVAVLSLAAQGVSVVGTSEVGPLPESAGMSPDDRFIYVGNYGTARSRSWPSARTELLPGDRTCRCPGHRRRCASSGSEATIRKRGP